MLAKTFTHTPSPPPALAYAVWIRLARIRRNLNAPVPRPLARRHPKRRAPLDHPGPVRPALRDGALPGEVRRGVVRLGRAPGRDGGGQDKGDGELHASWQETGEENTLINSVNASVGECKMVRTGSVATCTPETGRLACRDGNTR